MIGLAGICFACFSRFIFTLCVHLGILSITSKYCLLYSPQVCRKCSTVLENILVCYHRGMYRAKILRYESHTELAVCMLVLRNRLIKQVWEILKQNQLSKQKITQGWTGTLPTWLLQVLIIIIFCIYEICTCDLKS